jgi:hypothetical protein
LRKNKKRETRARRTRRRMNKGPIEFVALKCAACGVFQSQQRRKDRKFACRMCGAKQSVTKVFAISHAAKDIRGVVQRYNELRSRGEDIPDDAREEGQEEEQQEVDKDTPPPQPGEWQQWLDPPKDDGEGVDDEADVEAEAVAASASRTPAARRGRAKRPATTPYSRPAEPKSKSAASASSKWAVFLDEPNGQGDGDGDDP